MDMVEYSTIIVNEISPDTTLSIDILMKTELTFSLHSELSGPRMNTMELYVIVIGRFKLIHHFIYS